MDTRLWGAVEKSFLRRDFSGAAEMLERRLRKRNPKRFRTLLDGRFKNDPAAVLESINTFIESCSGEFSVKAVYLEMNGFDVNYDRWYFECFAYDHCGTDPRNLDWLSDWQSESGSQIELKGLEPVQRDFQWFHSNRIYDDESFRPVYQVALLLVATRFVQLIEDSLASGKLVRRIPVLATAHEFDIVGRFEP